MTQQEILAYNKRCAEFLGFKYKNQNKFWAIYPLDNNSFLRQFGYVKMNNLKFHSDWNWIMEVVEAIEKLTFNVRITRTCITVETATDCTLNLKTIYVFHSGEFDLLSKKEAVVQAINQFLIWYEQNKRSMKKFDTLQVGDVVTRMLGGSIPMELKITEITEDLIICGAWKFSKNNGAEIDEDLGWDEKNTGSYIKS